ncbi:16S rRNA (cytosine(1402)-N(4))-methyltransferase [Tumebacillus algifaecis]|uniref:16S rRNA (Cytosine(1402)-N(4))-methyltransferase n=1 Tax=Tumebacillus algifaecis TaxID=1214604 RepID=A0A223D478_9BACL|nr:class I SAM-dependent methyltransferase [Tumebacillus algifaecis]ASS76408.1 16S rRNA (cytosine(1402)-N(4))-methyltransferase [Tumebacillus algifaecis]
MVIRPMLRFVKELLTDVLKPGDVAIDATVGKGSDTLFLAETVGATGRVIGFDVQEAALRRAWDRLTDAGVCERVELHLVSHAQMQDVVPSAWHGRVQAITFNLGYLPGGDPAVVTTTESTLTALQAGLNILSVGGVMTVMLYSGHDAGKAETQAVLAWAQAVDVSQAHVLQYRFLNQQNDPPILLALEKRAQ